MQVVLNVEVASRPCVRSRGFTSQQRPRHSHYRDNIPWDDAINGHFEDLASVSDPDRRDDAGSSAIVAKDVSRLSKTCIISLAFALSAIACLDVGIGFVDY